jgi:hypothetical protein
MPASFADKATSHSTKPASWQVAGYARLLALHPKKRISKEFHPLHTKKWGADINRITR